MNLRPLKLLFLIVLIAIAIALSMHDYTEKIAPLPEEKRMNLTPLPDAFGNIELADMPSLVPMTSDQSLYVVALAQTAIKVLQKTKTLEQAETEIFGEGDFHWPKDPKKPIKISKSYRAENFRMKFISLGFRRNTPEGDWLSAGLSVEPKNSSKSAYQIDLPSSFFDGMILDKAVTEDRPVNGATPAHNVHIFQFHTSNNGIKVQLKFETREDLSNIKDKYPKSFHSLEITRVD